MLIISCAPNATLRRRWGSSCTRNMSITTVELLVLIFFLVIVKVWKRVAYVLDLDLGAGSAEFERVDVDRIDEAGECYLLEFLVDKGTNLLGKGGTIRARRDGFPSNFDRHAATRPMLQAKQVSLEGGKQLLGERSLVSRTTRFDSRQPPK